MATKIKNDACELLDDGKVRVTFGGASRTLERPKIGQMKRYNADLMDLAKHQNDARESGADMNLDDVIQGTLEWWTQVIDELKGEDELPCPSDPDEFPMWLMNSDLIVKVQAHWREVPYISGGK
jgi:hypothetical protein